MIFNIIQTFREMPRMALVVILAYVIAILFAITFHEFGHAFAAYKCGDPTAKFSGRLTLNPLKHLDPIGMVMLILVGFGWAKPVQINPRNFNNYKKDSIWVSLAGITTNFIIAFLGSACMAILFASAKNINTQLVYGVEPSAVQYVYYFFYTLFQYTILINLTLFAFNLLPIYPLDGFRVVEMCAKPNSKYVDFMYRHGNYILLALLLASMVLGKISPYLDIFSLYINGVRSLVSMIFNAIFGIGI